MLANKNVIITGGASGIGACTAQIMANEGANVVILDIQDENGEALSKSINESGNRSIYCHGDVSISDEIRAVVKETLRVFGGLDILINNAAYQSIHSFFDLSEVEWKKAIDVNLTGCFLFTQIAAKEMNRGGSIINVNSIHCEIPRMNKYHYDASKAGIAMLTQESALALAPYGIRVNGIAAGVIATPMNNDWLNNSEIVEQTIAKVPLGRLGVADDIAKAILFLSSANYITGATLYVDGGRSLT